MSERRTEVTPELERILAPYWEAVDPLILRIQEDLHRRDKYPMQISFEQVGFHGWICRLVGARQVLEVGTYLGLSASAFALAMGPEGHVDTVEVSDEHAEIAEDWFREGGLGTRVKVHRGPALEVVPGLPGPYDVCFLDGAKVDNPKLLPLCVEKTRPGGLILCDNAFRSGNLGGDDPDAVATRQVLDAARNDERLDPVVLPVADGILACRRL
ncbi:MAG: O-methyltransferase [Candidatus Dormibacteraeota bacterium]|nr:O-methyltransferase [Candidatus Dormibacteraeota bacterium]